MKSLKRLEKENIILDASEKVFTQYGFKNARMEEIAREAGITKVTLYSYFQSKENLYMAITYRAFQILLEEYYQTLDNCKSSNGLECSIALMNCFMRYCEENFLLSEAILEYFTLVRSTSQGKDEEKLTDAMKESIYYRKLQDVELLPFKLVNKEIERGKKDGSIHKNIDPMTITLHAWTMLTGYAKIAASSGSNISTMFKVQLSDLKNLNIAWARHVLIHNPVPIQNPEV